MSAPERYRPLPSHLQHPDHIGRYRIDAVLGQGPFGVVYSAHDEQLDRPVALKVPHPGLVSSTERAAEFLAELRKAAKLDHRHIVPVYDVGCTNDFPLYIVSKRIDGDDLLEGLDQSRLSDTEAADLVASIAETLHYAHMCRVVHRNVKPGNILVDSNGEFYLTDFGVGSAACAHDGWWASGVAATPSEPHTLECEELEQDGSTRASPSQDFGRESCGQPVADDRNSTHAPHHYMSPEQVRGGGHQIDGRTDIFSLGVVLYELLSGEHPFASETPLRPFEQSTSHAPRPLRRDDDQIPEYLERICDRAMAKRPADRYSTAMDFAEDLRHFVAEISAHEDSLLAAETVRPDSTSSAPQSGSTTLRPDAGTATQSNLSSGSQPLKIVPKSLRSFDAHDADFFLELLPGPRDRSGLPESIRFWKTRIEEAHPAKTFSVGLIYGPSGCGKSSLVKAGLLPRLSEDVITVYVEATALGTEQRLVRDLRRCCENLDQNSNFQETLTALRCGQGIPVARKVLIVVDQFEQWLHANTDVANTDLVKGLRQCDGGRLQCIVMVRDDFWLAATRFMGELEIDLLQGQNSALVDLFDLDHARKVLAGFGRAFGQLPEQRKATSKQQRNFLNAAAAGLAEDGKISCVRLALFAEMMKSKSWTPTALKLAGGIHGVGLTFLEETFSARTSHPKHRLHQQAARAVLRALLPEPGSDIKGQMRSSDELLDASGYTRRPKDFSSLIQLLDSELRLITPTEAVEAGADGPWRETDQKANGGPRLSRAGNVAASHRIGRSAAAMEEDTLTSPLHPPPSPAIRYQLTHDYLVPSLRNWLTLQQRETLRGRAELKLDERAAVWSRRPESRHLPSIWEYLRIIALTRWSDWTKPQAEVMRRATRVHGLRWVTALLASIAVATAFAQYRASQERAAMSYQTRALLDGLANSGGGVVPLAINDLKRLPANIVLAELSARYDAEKKLSLAYALAEFGGTAKVDVDYLVSEIEAARPDEVENTVRALNQVPDASLRALKSAAAEAEKQNKWSLKARLAMVALHLRNADLAAEMCTNRADPVQRSMFIKECATWHGDLHQLVNVLPDVHTPALRSGLCLGIGSIEFQQDQAWMRVFKDWYTTQRDTGIHSAADWALRKWNQDLPEITPSREPTPEHDWYVNSSGMTMLKIFKGTITYRQDDSDEIDAVSSTVDEDFWLADREVSIGQYEQFVKDAEYPTVDRPMNWRRDTRGGQESRSDSQPVTNVILNDAVLFCNWLSIKEDRRPCYHFTGKVIESFPAGNPAYSHGGFRVWELDPFADGYRLPMEAEWDYAQRAGTTTTFSCGDNLELLPDYVVYRVRLTQEGGTKLPNGWGLFDMYGNAGEWCNCPKPTLGHASDLIPGSLRGGSCIVNTLQLAHPPVPFGPAAQGDRSFMESYNSLSPLFAYYGFRVARNASQ